jgi:hypothetical protein
MNWREMIHLASACQHGKDAMKGTVPYICANCFKRIGDLVCQAAMPAQRTLKPPIPEPWVFRHYLCRWCRGAWNRHRMPTQRPMTVLEYKPDADVLANRRNQRAAQLIRCIHLFFCAVNLW